MLNRRQFARGVAALSVLAVSATPSRAEATNKLTEAFTRIEAESGGRLGVAVFDSENGMQTAYRGDERFPMCSTSKLMSVAAILKRIDTGKLATDRRVVFSAADLV